MKKAVEAIRFSGAGLFFVGAAFLAILTGWSIYGYLKSAAPSVAVIVATRDLPPGTVISERDVTTRQVAKAALPEGALTSKLDLVGSRTLYGLASGDLVRNRHLVPPGSSDIARSVADFGEEYRAVMLPGELVPAADRLVPGDRLELTGVLPVHDSRVNSAVAVHVGFATVLDVSQGRGQNDRSVLVALRSAEVSHLALVMRSGSLMVAIHGSGHEPTATPTTRLETLISSTNGAAQ